MVDDQSPRVRYTGNWETAGNPQEFQGSTHGTKAAGAQAAFTFKGLSVSVYGTIEHGGDGPSGAPTSSYSIDGSTPASFVGTPPGANIAYKQQYFQSARLDPSKEHTLVITCIGTGGNTFWLDFIEVTTDAPAAQSNPSPSPSSHTPVPSPSLKPTQSAISSPGGSHSGDLPKGLIIGITVGGIASLLLVVVIILLLCCLVRPRRRRREEALVEEATPRNHQAATVHTPPSPASALDMTSTHVSSSDGYVVRGGLSHEKAGNGYTDNRDLHQAPVPFNRGREETGRYSAATASTEPLPSYESSLPPLPTSGAH
ncbi:hypothetical protein FPV67DRAFT_1451557 [Lyophyllum atratum]|nr:hypothetical protein FPV67DRAFT_1451557 [Lyophyllum atratum]